MSPFRFPEPLPRDACRATGVLPPHTSRGRDCSTEFDARTRVEEPHERAAESLRRREKYLATVMLAGAVSAALTGTVWAAGLIGDADHGRALYEARQGCDALTQNDVGPSDRGAMMLKAASLSDYDYSDAVKSANIVWNKETLDKWLTDPQAVAPGAKMFFHLENPQDRADVIAYLKERAK
jgi:cytochrome c